MSACALPKITQTGPRSQFLGELFATQRPRLERLALVQTRNRDDAMDMVQEAFLRALEGSDRLRSGRAAFAWMRRITSNRCHDLHRYRRARPQESLDALAERAESSIDRFVPAKDAGVLAGLDRSLLGERVRAAVESLPLPQRTICRMWYWEELPIAEISRRLGVALGTAKSRLAVARETLATRLRSLARSLGYGADN